MRITCSSTLARCPSWTCVPRTCTWKAASPARSLLRSWKPRKPRRTRPSSSCARFSTRGSIPPRTSLSTAMMAALPARPAICSRMPETPARSAMQAAGSIGFPTPRVSSSGPRRNPGVAFYFSMSFSRAVIRAQTVNMRAACSSSSMLGKLGAMRMLESCGSFP